MSPLDRNTPRHVRPIRVLVCDDHHAVREGLRMLFARHGGVEVVAEAANATEAIDAAVRVTPDVAVVDVRLSGGRGVEVCRVLREILPATKVIMHTHYPDDEGLYGSIVAGASAYVLKQTPARTLVAVIEEVAAGATLLDFELATQALERLRRAPTEIREQRA